MSTSVKDILAAKGIHPSSQELEALENKWAEYQALKKGIEDLALNDADIALRNIPGGDHVA